MGPFFHFFFLLSFFSLSPEMIFRLCFHITLSALLLSVHTISQSIATDDPVSKQLEQRMRDMDSKVNPCSDFYAFSCGGKNLGMSLFGQLSNDQFAVRYHAY